MADDNWARRLDDPRLEAFGMLMEAHNEVATALRHRLEQLGDVPSPWLSVLIRLARSPGHRMRMTELANDMTMSTSGLTRLVDRIEAEGHVRREACPGDRRGLNVTLTESGAQVLRRVGPVHLDDLGTYLGDALDPDELIQLTNLLRKVRNHVRSTGTPT